MGRLDFGRVGRVLDHIIDKFVQLILETRKGYNQTVYLFTPSGDNSVPCKEDRLIILKVDGTGKYLAVAVATESQGANPGEKIFFARDQNNKIVSKITMLNDGSVSLDTDTETTGEASGNYNRKIKGNENIDILKNKTETIGGNYKLNVSGNFDLNAGGIVTINGQRINLN
jgi:hypothetical protein